MNCDNSQNTPEKVLNEILPFLMHVYRIYEEAVPEATFDEFTSKGEEIEHCHHSSAVRFRVKRRLKKNMPLGLAFELYDIANNGLHTTYDGRAIRFYKSVNGHPPACGNSQARKSFYQQSLFGEDHELELSIGKLVVIYSVARDGTFLGLDLCCAKGVISDYAPPELYWSIPVPHPATVQSSELKYNERPDELEDIKHADEDDEDLDISLDGTEDK